MLEELYRGTSFDHQHLLVKTHKAILVRRYRDEAVKQGWDLSKVQELFETIKETVQPFTDKQTHIPCFMKA